MKRFIIAVSLALAFASCHRCQNFTRVEQAPLIKKYFGIYKPGAYWIYLNRDSTKRDSVWISDYVLTTGKDRLDKCLEMEESQFTLNSSYFPRGTRSSIGPSGGDFKYTIADVGGFFIADNDDSSFTSSGGSSYWPIVRNYALWPNATGRTIVVSKAIQTNEMVIAPDTGIVQYIFPIGVDTFSLIKFQKQ